MKCSVTKREDFTLHFISMKVRKKKGFNVTSEEKRMCSRVYYLWEEINEIFLCRAREALFLFYFLSDE